MFKLLLLTPINKSKLNMTDVAEFCTLSNFVRLLMKWLINCISWHKQHQVPFVTFALAPVKLLSSEIYKFQIFAIGCHFQYPWHRLHIPLSAMFMLIFQPISIIKTYYQLNNASWSLCLQTYWWSFPMFWTNTAQEITGEFELQ